MSPRDRLPTTDGERPAWRDLGHRQRGVLEIMASKGGADVAWHASTERVMESLERRGLVKYAGEAGEYRGRRRNRYRLTLEGREVTEAWLAHRAASTRLFGSGN